MANLDPLLYIFKFLILFNRYSHRYISAAPASAHCSPTQSTRIRLAASHITSGQDPIVCTARYAGLHKFWQPGFEKMGREWENEEEMEREWGNGERSTLFISSLSIHFLYQIFFSGFFPKRNWGVPPPPLNGQSLCSKKLSGQGGTPPLTGKIR